MSRYQRVVIYGPPGCGKTTLARQRCPADGIIWDLDDICAALNPLFADFEDRPKDICFLALGFREVLVEKLMRNGLHRDVFLIISDEGPAVTIADLIGAELTTP